MQLQIWVKQAGQGPEQVMSMLSLGSSWAAGTEEAGTPCPRPRSVFQRTGRQPVSLGTGLAGVGGQDT